MQKKKNQRLSDNYPKDIQLQMHYNIYSPAVECLLIKVDNTNTICKKQNN